VPCPSPGAESDSAVAAPIANGALAISRRAQFQDNLTAAGFRLLSSTWKLLIALSRFAGLRVPSEALSLRWSDVDWERQRLTIPIPKTQHLAGRSHRVIPLFPAIKPFLEAAWGAAPERAEYIPSDEYRRRAQCPAGWRNANLRTTLAKIIRRAGLEPWPRLWHSMRASCETDLARQFPLAVAAKRLGNTQAVAMRHYVEVTGADFARATASPDNGTATAIVEAAQKAAQQMHANAARSRRPFSRRMKSPCFAGACEFTREPAYRDQRRARDSNPQPLSGHHISSVAPRQFGYPPQAANVTDQL